MTSTMAIALLALVFSNLSLGYSLVQGRRTRKTLTALAEMQCIGYDAWVGEQVQRWHDGDLPSRLVRGARAGVSDVEVIEPIPGWTIIVGTWAQGIRYPAGDGDAAPDTTGGAAS